MRKFRKINVMKKSLSILLFIVLTFVIYPANSAMADEEMTSSLICPCECAMIISTCDCTTAIQVKKEIYQMKENGFSEKQILSALKAEYGNDILVKPEKGDPVLLWAGASLAAMLVFLAFILSRKPKPGIIPLPDREKYERRFQEEYEKFVSGLDENKEADPEHSSEKEAA